MTADVQYLFLDLNSYFASVEQQENPAYRGRPLAVVPTMTDKTCAIAASYEAKALGITTGTMIYEAKKLCPSLIIVQARHDVYVDYHHAIMAELERLRIREVFQKLLMQVSDAIYNPMMTEMNKTESLFLGTVNAPFKKMIYADGLAMSLFDESFAAAHISQLSVFFGEVKPSLQQNFVKEHNI